MRLSLFSADRAGFSIERPGLPAERHALRMAFMAGMQNGVRAFLATMRQIGDAIAAGETFDLDRAMAVRENHGRYP